MHAGTRCLLPLAARGGVSQLLTLIPYTQTNNDDLPDVSIPSATIGRRKTQVVGVTNIDGPNGSYHFLHIYLARY